TKVIGAVGPCGRELCCSSWLRDFDSVTVKMARDQGLALNPSRLAGMCGRLKCCLRYEYASYLELKRGLPNIGNRVESVKGDAMGYCASARSARRRPGDDRFTFLSGTDEHGDKIRRAALAQGLKPKAYTDRMSEIFREAFAGLNVTAAAREVPAVDFWVRTTD